MKKLIAAVVLAGTPVLAAAQSPPVLTLDDALRLARQNNPQYLKVLNDLDAAAAETRAKWGAFLPQVSSNLSFNGGASTTVTGQDNYGQPIRRPDPTTYRSSSASQGVSMTMTLFDGGQNIRNLGIARAGERATEASIRAEESRLITQVTNEFFGAVKMLRLIEVEQANLTAAQDRLERTEAQFRIAKTNQVDVLGANREVINAERRLITARANADKARLQLAQTLGMEGGWDFAPDTDLPPVFDPAGLDEEALVGRALASNPAVLKTQAELVTAENRSSAQRGARWPRITGSMGFTRGMSQAGYGAFGEFNPLNRNFGFSLSASLPIFSRFETSASIAQADAAETDAREEVRRMRLDVERKVRETLIDLQTAHRGLELALENARISAEQVELAEELYRAGSDRYDFLQLQQLIEANQAAQREAVDAQFTFITARATLEEILGGPLNP